MRSMVENSRAIMADIKGLSVELYPDISSPPLTPDDFRFKPPEGTVLKESLFGDILRPSRQ